MEEKDLLEKFDINLSKIRSRSDETPKLVDECISHLRGLNSLPKYQLGEFKPIISEKINTLCKTTGASYESVLMKMQIPKF